jgi:hypothetical protein
LLNEMSQKRELMQYKRKQEGLPQCQTSTFLKD